MARPKSIEVGPPMHYLGGLGGRPPARATAGGWHANPHPLPKEERELDNVLIIGAGAAGSVVAKKCAMNRDVFKKIHLASRRLESCKRVQAAAKSPIDISQVDADNVGETVA